MTKKDKFTKLLRKRSPQTSKIKRRREMHKISKWKREVYKKFEICFWWFKHSFHRTQQHHIPPLLYRIPPHTIVPLHPYTHTTAPQHPHTTTPHTPAHYCTAYTHTQTHTAIKIKGLRKETNTHTSHSHTHTRKTSDLCKNSPQYGEVYSCVWCATFIFLVWTFIKYWYFSLLRKR